MNAIQKIILLFLMLFGAFGILQEDVNAQEIGYVRVGDKANEEYLLEESTDEIKQQTVFWEFVAMHDPEARELILCAIDEENLTLAYTKKINVNENGAAGFINLRKGKFRIEIRNATGDILGKSLSFSVYDSREI